MNKYILVFTEENNIRFGRHIYNNIQEAENRLNILIQAGIKNATIMNLEDAFN